MNFKVPTPGIDHNLRIAIDLNGWRCPWCERHATLRVLQDFWSSRLIVPKHGDDDAEQVRVCGIRCPNATCGRIQYVAVHESGEYGDGPIGRFVDDPQYQNHWNLLPESSARTWPAYIPKALVGDYRESCLIVAKSPKASATLSRRVLQGMITDYWGILPKGPTRTLAKQIEALQGRITGDLWDAIDALRKVGNIGAHMEEDINVIIDVDEGEAVLLIELIEMLFDGWYVTRNNQQASLKKITAMAATKKTPVARPSTPPATTP